MCVSASRGLIRRKSISVAKLIDVEETWVKAGQVPSPRSQSREPTGEVMWGPAPERGRWALLARGFQAKSKAVVTSAMPPVPRGGAQLAHRHSLGERMAASLGETAADQRGGGPGPTSQLGHSCWRTLCRPLSGLSTESSHLEALPEVLEALRTVTVRPPRSLGSQGARWTQGFQGLFLLSRRGMIVYFIK